MKKKRLVIVVGTRPNFIKITCFKDYAEEFPGIEIIIVHTGQHSDEKMAGVFFTQFNLLPDHIISLAGTSPVSQIAEIMQALEKLFTEIVPDCVMVVGDVNSTLAAAVVSNKMYLNLVHLESGLRSKDLTMPEEWNRLITDKLAKDLFVTEEDGVKNLMVEGKDQGNIHLVGNTMIDSLVKYKNAIEANKIIEQLDLENQQYILMTTHRPATVDNEVGLNKLLQLIKKIANHYLLVFPIHPRTRQKLEKFGLAEEAYNCKRVKWIDPLDYFSFQKLIKHCMAIVTDSGGIQEEATFCKVPCFTARENTERPVTITEGTNTLVPLDGEILTRFLNQVREGKYKQGSIPSFWDGHATKRILGILQQKYFQ